MNNYLASINKVSHNQCIEDVLLQAKDLSVPIISDEGINMLIQLIKIGGVKRVLEIGTAIGYSAIMMALNTDCKVLSIEKNSDSFLIAKENIKKCGLDDRIQILNQDALLAEIEGEFDLLFIDAAKAQYLNFLNRFKNNVRKSGIVVCDNLLFHGMVENEEIVSSKKTKSLVSKLRGFNSQLVDHPEFDTYIYAIGDGLSISIKK